MNFFIFSEPFEGENHVQHQKNSSISKRQRVLIGNLPPE
jgi:hypothetical protein